MRTLFLGGSLGQAVATTPVERSQSLWQGMAQTCNIVIICNECGACLQPCAILTNGLLPIIPGYIRIDSALTPNWLRDSALKIMGQPQAHPN